MFKSRLVDRTAARDFDAAEHFDTDPALVGRAFNRIRKSTLETQVGSNTAGSLDLLSTICPQHKIWARCGFYRKSILSPMAIKFWRSLLLIVSPISLIIEDIARRCVS